MQHVPQLSALHPAHNGEGLLLSGYVATWAKDRQDDHFAPYSLDLGISRFMATNPVLLWQHKMGLPPIGRIVTARVERDKGLYIEALMPAPDAKSWARPIYEAAAAGILRALSLGGRWSRQIDPAMNGYKIVGADVLECSLTSVAANGEAFASEVASVAGVKGLTGSGAGLGLERAALERKYLAAAGTALDLVALRLDVASMLRS